MLQKLILGGMQDMDPFNANFLTTQQCLRSLVLTAPLTLSSYECWLNTKKIFTLSLSSGLAGLAGFVWARLAELSRALRLIQR